MEERVGAVDKVLAFQEQRMEEADLTDMYEKEEQLKSAIVFAREYMKTTKVSTEQLGYLCEEAVRGGCQVRKNIAYCWLLLLLLLLLVLFLLLLMLLLWLMLLF